MRSQGKKRGREERKEGEEEDESERGRIKGALREGERWGRGAVITDWRDRGVA